ncbi:HlyD family secretion protein [Xylophilus sp. ASV27]|uniref:HlyD family secretion protein n=1 Tax=Xylophilus sp. ASV27 TaxID=2795129 RepID=UPI0018ED67DF|nr:HlyD family efflux transporter periplasmic adaptor subunit [Xylophilus sp. ASV27]
MKQLRPRPRRIPAALGASAVLAATAAVPLLLAGCFDGGRPSASAIAQAQAQGAPAGPADVAIARGRVEIEGGLLELMPQQDGVVESVAVAEGAAVKRGQTLLRLQSDAARGELAMAEAELQAAQARQRAQAARLAPARQLSQRLLEAAQAGALERQRADEAQQAQQEAAAALAVAEADTKVAAQKLAQARSRVARLTLTAPQDGTVLRLRVQPGSAVDTQGSRPLMVLLPQRPLLVRAELNGSFAARVQPGMRASVHVDGGPALPARVQRISPVYAASRLDEDQPARIGVRVVECFLTFDQPSSLRIGQEVRVHFQP